MPRKALSAIGVVVLAACASRGSQGTPAPSPTPRPRAIASPTSVPVHIETNSNGTQYLTIVVPVLDARTKRAHVAYELRARSSQSDIVDGQSVAVFEQAHITFHDRNGKVLIADSPQAKLTQQNKRVLMRGGVHARADDGSVLTCDTLRYDGDTERLHGEGHVVVSGPNALTLTGNYLDSDVRLEDVRVGEHPL